LSFLPDNDSFRQFLQVSFAILHQECLPAYQAMCTLLAHQQVQINVEGELVSLVFEPHKVRLLPEVEAQPSVTLLISRQTLLDLADGRYALQEAILSEAVQLHGNLSQLVLFHEGWLAYMRGAVRCVSFPDLLERFRSSTPAPASVQERSKV
jgi:hypothetical protein